LSDGNSIQLKRGSDGKFKCGCGKRFKLPASTRDHAKSCQGVTEEEVDRVTGQEVRGEVIADGDVDRQEEEQGDEEEAEADRSFDITSILPRHY